MPTLIWIVSALAAGVLARVVMKSRGFGFTGDAVLGVLGSVSGAWLLRFVGGEVSPGGIAHIATAFVGAMFGGSWTFLGCFAAFMLAWMFLNTATARPADPYPFILLNLILSCLAAVQAPIILMSQNRQAARDRFEAQQDYQVNVRAEMQISELHMKLDEARNVDWQAVIALQRQQLDILERIQRSLADNEQR